MNPVSYFTLLSSEIVNILVSIVKFQHWPLTPVQHVTEEDEGSLKDRNAVGSHDGNAVQRDLFPFCLISKPTLGSYIQNSAGACGERVTDQPQSSKFSST